MAVTITQQPTTPNAAYTELIYVVSGSTNVGQPQFEYIMDLYESGSSTLLYRSTQPIDPSGVSVFNPSKVIQGQLEYDTNWKNVINSSSLSSNKNFTLKFGEKYGTSISSSVTIYPNLTTSELSIISATVDPNQGSFNLLDVYPRIKPPTGSLYDFQLSDNPYLFVLKPNNPYPYTSLLGYSYIPLGNEDYCTVSYLMSGSITPRVGQVSVYDNNSVKIFDGFYFNTVGSEGYYTGSFPSSVNIINQGIGPKNLRDVPMLTSLTASLGNQTFGDVIDSGSWFYYTATLTLSNLKLDDCYVVNENKTILLPSYTSFLNTSVPYFDANNEKLRFAFINKYGVYDYWTNYNPVRRSSEISRDNVKLPNVDYSSATSIYDITRRGDLTYNVELADRFVVDTPYLDQVMSNWLEQLIDSPSVYIQRGDDFVPIVITNSTYTVNTDENRQKLFKYTIEFEPSNQPYGSWTVGYADPLCILPTPSVTPSPTPTPSATPGASPTPTPTPTPTPSATPPVPRMMYPDGMVTSSLVHFYNAWDSVNTSQTWYDTQAYTGSGAISGSIVTGSRFTNSTVGSITNASYYGSFTGVPTNPGIESYPAPVDFGKVWPIVTNANSSSAYTVQTFAYIENPPNLWQGVWYVGPNTPSGAPTAGQMITLETSTFANGGVAPNEVAITYEQSNVTQQTQYFDNLPISNNDWSLFTVLVGSGSNTPNIPNLYVSVNTSSFYNVTGSAQLNNIPSTYRNILGQSRFPQTGYPNGHYTWNTANKFMYHAIYDRTLTEAEVQQNYLAFYSSSYS